MYKIYVVMKSRLFLIFLFSLLDSLAFAQKSEHKMVFSISDSIGEAFLSCDYRYMMKLKGGSIKSSEMRLQIGKDISKFEGVDLFKQDSLSLALGNKKYPVSFLLQKSNNLGLGHSSTRWKLYTNYPKGKITICDRVFTDYFKSVEPMPEIKWYIDFDSTKNIMGYNCQKATAEIFGRKWVAWYTKEIPYPQGPWLIQGLPGLVVQAYDTKKEHDFLLFAVKKVNTPIGFVKHDYFNSPRKTVIKQKLRYYANRGKMIQNSGLVTAVNGKPAENNYTPDEDPLAYYNPLRLYYK